MNEIIYFLIPAEKHGKKPKKMIRMAGGQMWEDSSLLQWDPNDFRLFCGDLGNDVTDEVSNFFWVFSMMSPTK